MVFQIASEAGAAETGDIETVDGQIVAVDCFKVITSVKTSEFVSSQQKKKAQTNSSIFYNLLLKNLF